MSKKLKYCETLKPGFYLQETQFGKRAYYFSGSTKGNKWVDLDVTGAKWMGLLWTCLPDEQELSIGTVTFHGDSNPTGLPFNN